MIEVMRSEKELLIGILEREFRGAVRMMGAYPIARLDDRADDCGRTGRELAWAFVERERLMQYVALGRMATTEQPAPGSLREIVAAHHTEHRQTCAALRALTPAQWSESMRGPAGLDVWGHGRRSELLWLAWKDLVRHGAHFSVHLSAARAVTGVPAVPGSPRYRYGGRRLDGVAVA
jgi:hypothetical protein